MDQGTCGRAAGDAVRWLVGGIKWIFITVVGACLLCCNFQPARSLKKVSVEGLAGIKVDSKQDTSFVFDHTAFENVQRKILMAKGMSVEQALTFEKFAATVSTTVDDGMVCEKIARAPVLEHDLATAKDVESSTSFEMPTVSDLGCNVDESVPARTTQNGSVATFSARISVEGRMLQRYHRKSARFTWCPNYCSLVLIENDNDGSLHRALLLTFTSEDKMKLRTCVDIGHFRSAEIIEQDDDEGVLKLVSRNRNFVLLWSQDSRIWLSRLQEAIASLRETGAGSSDESILSGSSSQSFGERGEQGPGEVFTPPPNANGATKSELGLTGTGLRALVFELGSLALSCSVPKRLECEKSLDEQRRRKLRRKWGWEREREVKEQQRAEEVKEQQQAEERQGQAHEGLEQHQHQHQHQDQHQHR
jgi:hypothetical protein